MKNIKVLESDLIALNGGGFFGDLYPMEMYSIIDIIKKYKNKTIVFPQTVYFKEKDDLFLQFKDVVNNHGDVTFFAREQKSYDFASNLGVFNRVFLVPDIVLFENPEKKSTNNENSKILLVLRKDEESIINKNDLLKDLKIKGFDIEETDTIYHESTRIYPKDRKKIINDKINEFKNADIVVTDRLHGMIFGYISGSYCIAMDNLTGKSFEVYKQWLSDIDRINFISDPNELIKSIEEIVSRKDIKDISLRESFKPLENILSSYFDNSK